MRRRIIAAMFLGAAILSCLECLIVGIVPTLDPGYVQLGLFCLTILAVIAASLVAKPLLTPPEKTGG